jgi:predicted DNA-binding transcriptional regulator YafY
VLPPAYEADTAALLVGPGEAIAAGDTEVATLRESFRAEHKLGIRYRDTAGAETARTIWPFALGFFDCVRVVVAWCELRQAIRHFRTDRIVQLTPSGARYPQRRQALLKAWRVQEGIADPMG